MEHVIAIPATANQKPKQQTAVIVKAAGPATAVTVTAVLVIAARVAASVIQKNAVR